MQHHIFNTTIEKGMIFIPENILSKLSSQVKVVILSEKKTDDITLASEKSLASDWLLPDEDLIWQNL